jgi:hypothetical protein
MPDQAFDVANPPPFGDDTGLSDLAWRQVSDGR